MIMFINDDLLELLLIFSLDIPFLASKIVGMKTVFRGNWQK
jgi:hypothetical protein